MRQQYAYFKELPIGTEFHRNGNRWVKKSTRTAFLVEYNRVFYFLQNDLCIVGIHDKLEV